MLTIPFEQCPGALVHLGAMKRRRRAGQERVNHVQTAVEFLGGVQEAAETLGVSRATIYKWLKAGDESRVGNIAYKYVMALASASGVPPWVLSGIPKFEGRKDW